jgi:hypothetical protein
MVTQRVTIGEIINYVDNIKPNIRSKEEKIMWLNNLDTTVKEDIYDLHEGGEEYSFEGYDENTPDNTALLIPAHYGREIYRYYLELQIDFINKEYDKYNSATAQFQSHYQSFELYWHNKHKPLQFNSIGGI